jgi:hypothetical protein
MKVLARYYPQYISARPTPAPAPPDDDLDYYYSDREGGTKHLRDYWQGSAEAVALYGADLLRHGDLGDS